MVFQAFSFWSPHHSDLHSAPISTFPLLICRERKTSTSLLVLKSKINQDFIYYYYYFTSAIISSGISVSSNICILTIVLFLLSGWCPGNKTDPCLLSSVIPVETPIGCSWGWIPKQTGSLQESRGCIQPGDWYYSLFPSGFHTYISCCSFTVMEGILEAINIACE